MARNDDLNSRYAALRGTLRLLGPVLVVTGAGFMAVGFIDFFSAFGTFGPPRNFWACFVGLPILSVGIWMTKFGYLGVAAGYVAGEVAPVGKDVANYLGEGTRETVADLARAVGEGFAQARGQETAPNQCPQCHAANDADAGFCSACGAALKKTKRCPACGHLGDADAKFCDKCGGGLG